MDKKDAEAEAIKKAKDAQAAAGKNSGMSGRDLVRRHFLMIFLDTLTKTVVHSSVLVQPGMV